MSRFPHGDRRDTAGTQLAAAAQDLRHASARQALAPGDVSPRGDPSHLKLYAPRFSAIGAKVGRGVVLPPPGLNRFFAVAKSTTTHVAKFLLEELLGIGGCVITLDESLAELGVVVGALGAVVFVLVAVARAFARWWDEGRSRAWRLP